LTERVPKAALSAADIVAANKGDVTDIPPANRALSRIEHSFPIMVPITLTDVPNLPAPHELRFEPVTTSLMIEMLSVIVHWPNRTAFDPSKASPDMDVDCPITQEPVQDELDRTVDPDADN
jgi:hypothetical protein